MHLTHYTMMAVSVLKFHSMLEWSVLLSVSLGPGFASCCLKQSGGSGERRTKPTTASETTSSSAWPSTTSFPPPDTEWKYTGSLTHFPKKRDGEEEAGGGIADIHVLVPVVIAVVFVLVILASILRYCIKYKKGCFRVDPEEVLLAAPDSNSRDVTHDDEPILSSAPTSASESGYVNIASLLHPVSRTASDGGPEYNRLVLVNDSRVVEDSTGDLYDHAVPRNGDGLYNVMQRDVIRGRNVTDNVYDHALPP